MSESRIRLDLKKGGRVSITKSAIVAAVRLLEQDTSVEFKLTSQEVANWVVSHIKATYTEVEEGFHIIGRIVWSEDPYSRVPVNASGLGHSRFACIINNNVFLKPSRLYQGLTVSEALPRMLALAIRNTPCVSIKENNIDDFI